MFVGKTPLIRLEKLPEEGSAEVYVKWEGANPTGSMKDRMALSMVEGAERRGDIAAGGRIVEYTGGSTGSSLAMVCATKGYEAHFASADCFAEEKIQTMRAFGATVEMFESADGKVTAELIQTMIARAAELAAEPNTFWTDQFNNVDNRAGYHPMGHEIADALDDEIDVFIQGVGTGGCFSGNAEILKELCPGITCVAIEPATSRALTQPGPYGGHRLEGMGAGFKPAIYREDLADEVVAVTDERAYEMARKLAEVEGIFGGISSGSNVSAALDFARRLGAGNRVVTVVCDSGLKYLQGDLFGPR
ncbi:MAG: PLP-dependent cysteine synthase family protein [Thermoanaerobaculia bacterium]